MLALALFYIPLGNRSAKQVFPCVTQHWKHLRGVPFLFWRAFLAGLSSRGSGPEPPPKPTNRKQLIIIVERLSKAYVCFIRKTVNFRPSSTPPFCQLQRLTSYLCIGNPGPTLISCFQICTSDVGFPCSWRY